MTVTKAKPGRRPGGTGGPNLVQGVSPQARRVAAAILEVLAGARTPTEAAAALELCVPRYYQLEAEALRGLLAACEPGRDAAATEQARLLRDNQRLQRDLLRQQALARAAQRTIGLSAVPPPAAAKPGKKPRRRRIARALSVAARLHADTPTGAAANPSSDPAATAATT